MGKLKELVFEIEEHIRAGMWPAEIEKLTGAPMSLILEVEEDVYESMNPRNYGPDYD